jgi:hypothetical protein
MPKAPRGRTPSDCVTSASNTGRRGAVAGLEPPQEPEIPFAVEALQQQVDYAVAAQAEIPHQLLVGMHVVGHQ